jgi:hypothetical protein
VFRVDAGSLKSATAPSRGALGLAIALALLGLVAGEN